MSGPADNEEGRAVPEPEDTEEAEHDKPPVALLAAAVLPGTGRDPAFRLQLDSELSGYAVVSDGELAGHLALFDESVVAGLHVAEAIVRSPEALANLLEAAGSIALERAGAILDQRVAGPSA